MKSVPLKAFQRSQVRRGEVKKLRATGRVPATIYGRLAQPQNLEVNSKEIADLLNHSASENLLVDLTVENDPRSEEHTSELQSRQYLVCRLLLEKKKQKNK